MGHDLLCFLIMLLLLDMTMELACIWTKCVCDGLKLLCFRYLWTHFVITMGTVMYEVLVNYLWNEVTCGLLCWITVILVVCKLVWNPSWFQLTIGFIWVQLWWFDHSGDCFHTYALINWSVLLQLVSELDSTLNMSHVYLKQRFLFAIINFYNL